MFIYQRVPHTVFKKKQWVKQTGKPNLVLQRNQLLAERLWQSWSNRQPGRIAISGKSMEKIWVWVNTYRYIFSGLNIHLPAILMFTRGTRF